MAAGVDHPALGYAAWSAVKFGGYALAAKWLDRRLEVPRNIWGVGLARLAIGAITGLGVWAAAQALAGLDSSYALPVAYVVLLFPVRMAEWFLLLRWAYRKAAGPRPGFGLLALLAAWSYVLDAPALAGLLVTAGVWIC